MGKARNLQFYETSYCIPWYGRTGFKVSSSGYQHLDNHIILLCFSLTMVEDPTKISHKYLHVVASSIGPKGVNQPESDNLQYDVLGHWD